jgi:phenylpropionate dioxygenase-like ring-hydroxylating dioxygenase large terminal subunit
MTGPHELIVTPSKGAAESRTAGPHPGRAPYEWYTSGELLDIERRRLFDRSWALVGTVEDLPEPGAYLTVTVGSSSLVVVRDEAGHVRAHHNLCRHRGLPLVEGEGHCGRFMTCRYHQWSYDLSGALRRVPQAEMQFPGTEPERWGLKPAAAAEWHGMVFTNPDPAAPPLSESIGFLDGRLAPFLSGPLVEVAKVEYTARCNWKLLVENHIDVYHLWYVHSRSLSIYEHRSFEWELNSDNWWSLEPLKDRSAAPDSGLDWIPVAERQGIGAHLMFPNLMLVTTGSYFGTYDAVPITPDTTRLTLRVRSVPGADGPSLVESVRSFLAEDVAVCELLQTSAGSSAFEYGPLAATHEAPVRALHEAIAARCYG